MSILQRLLLISASFLLPISVLLYFTVDGIQDRIDFAGLEKQGNIFQRPLEKILRSLLVHKSAALSVLEGCHCLDNCNQGGSNFGLGNAKS